MASEEGLPSASGTTGEDADGPDHAGDFLAGVVLFAVALYAFVESVRMPFYGDSGALGSPGLTPGLIAAVLLVLSALLMFRARHVRLSAYGVSFGIEQARAAATFALILAYAAAIPIAGYVPATFVMLFVFQFAFSGRRDLAFLLLWSLGLSAALTAALYFLFAEFFFIPLPRGPLGV